MSEQKRFIYIASGLSKISCPFDKLGTFPLFHTFVRDCFESFFEYTSDDIDIL